MFLKIGRYCVRGEKQPVIAELIFLSIDVKAGTKTQESPESRSLIIKRRELILTNEDLPLVNKQEANMEKREYGELEPPEGL